jgi:alkanesulfonate monooxygenase SsuD/methylene tetrahydromethanopterin reductase-like flavin-dependent oxidoreductase (luciferase family)
MTAIGYTMMCEQAPPDQLVRDVQTAERAGFDFSVISDHYQPWLTSQGHSGYAWSILGAAAQATEEIPLMTFVTCPIMRYHPAVVAQKAATMQILSGGRFRLGLGAGENLNEHVVGQGWPMAGVRHEMLGEAVEVISGLLGGDGAHTFRGEYYDVEQARLWDRPDRPVPIGQIALAYDADREAAVKRAHEQFRWFGLGWKVNADLPGPAAFESATEFVTPEQVAEQLPCGPDVDEHVAKIKPFVDAGFDEIALVQIGAAEQDAFMSWAQRELLPALRSL